MNDTDKPTATAVKRQDDQCFFQVAGAWHEVGPDYAAAFWTAAWRLNNLDFTEHDGLNFTAIFFVPVPFDPLEAMTEAAFNDMTDDSARRDNDAATRMCI